METKEKKWFILTMLLFGVFLVGLGTINAIVDPYFQYHTPLPHLKYTLEPEVERYLNDGIGKNFEYEAMITGTSLSENFRTSEFEELWGVKAVKTPFEGGTYKEIGDYLNRILPHKKETKYVLRTLDYNYLLYDKDKLQYDSYPTYLYDDSKVNDVNYLLNKSVLLKDTCQTFIDTLAGGTTTTFDEYGRWNEKFEFGKELVLMVHTRPEISETKAAWDEEAENRLKESLEQNILENVRNNPEVTYYLFFTPNSIVYWDSLSREGRLEQHFEAERTAIEMLLEQENIELYSFSNNFDLVCNLDHYKDVFHYSADINSQILRWIHDGEYRLTKENYEDYLAQITEFYSNYDYDVIFE